MLKENCENQTEKYDLTSWAIIARKRFELLSRAPEAPMLDHYTTGLRIGRKDYHGSM
jgi:hypothetical protein